MALTYKKNDDLEKLLDGFASFPDLEEEPKPKEDPADKFIKKVDVNK